MIPTLPFILGLVAGAAAVSVLRSERGRALLGSSAQQLRQTYAQAESQVSAAARSGLEHWRSALPTCGSQAKAEAGTTTAAPAAECRGADPSHDDQADITVGAALGASVEPAATAAGPPQRRSRRARSADASTASRTERP